MNWKFWKKKEVPATEQIGMSEEDSDAIFGRQKVPVYDAAPRLGTESPYESPFSKAGKAGITLPFPISPPPTRASPFFDNTPQPERNRAIKDRYAALSGDGRGRWKIIDQIASEYGISSTRVHQILRNKGPRVGRQRLNLDVDKIKADYAKLGNAGKVAALHGVSIPTITSRLRAAGIQVGAKHNPPSKRRLAASLLVREGKRPAQIAAALKMTPASVTRAIQKYGATIRPKSPWDSAENVEVLKDMWAKPKSYTVEDIAVLIECSPGAVRMKARRLKLPSRKSIA